MSARPRYVESRRLADGSTAYYWAVNRRIYPTFDGVRHLALGTDREAAFAVARRMNEKLPAKKWEPAGAMDRTALALRFKQLDDISRERALTDSESEQLEQVMADLGMI